MANLTYGAGIRILDQAVSLISLLGKARDALVLADQLEPTNQELSKIKNELSSDVASLDKNKVAIIAEIRAEKDKIISEQTAELAAMKDKAAKEAAESKKKFQDRLDLLTDAIETKTSELEILEKASKERKPKLDAEIKEAERRLEEVNKKILELQRI